MFDGRFTSVSGKFCEFWDLQSPRKFDLQNVLWQWGDIVWPMRENVHPISHHNPLDHGSQVVISCHIIMSNSMYDFVCILIPVNYYHHWFLFPRHLLFDPGRFDSNPLIFHVCIRWIWMCLVNGRVLLKDCSLVFYYLFPSKLSRHCGTPKKSVIRIICIAICWFVWVVF